MNTNTKISILGGGNIGTAIAKGLVNSKLFSSNKIIITRRRLELLKAFKEEGYIVQSDNVSAVKNSDIVIIAVTPQQLNGLLLEIRSAINSDNHLIISVVTGASIKEIRRQIESDKVPIVRAMPNTAIAVGESMTCIATDSNADSIINLAKQIFDSVGKTLLINEDQMIPATALCACGVAFFLRAIRAASQGGIEIGFHSEEAILMASQTAKGAASLLLSAENHPESEIDKVTTPRGCTISGLNQMEHHGFSSALIKGIVTSADKAAKLYTSENK
jgi:pyrroline-5-carboxylate reductase